MSEQQTLTDNMKLAPPVKTSFIFDIDYRKMYHNVRRCNDVVLHKLDKAQRSADYWKREHKLLIDTLWGWTTYQVKSKKPLHTPYPVKQKSKKKKAAATSFTFPPEQTFKDEPQTPASPLKTEDKTSNTPTKTAKRKAQVDDINKTQNTLRKRRTRKRLNLV